jgi:hypothetical protein
MVFKYDIVDICKNIWKYHNVPSTQHNNKKVQLTALLYKKSPQT